MGKGFSFVQFRSTSFNLVHYLSIYNLSLFFFADLSTVDKKVNNGDYTKLCEFIGDVMRIFENCRFFNQPNSSIMKSAESLENFFSQKLSHLRERVKPQAKQSCRLCKLSMQELMQWNQFSFFWQLLVNFGFFWAFFGSF